MAEANPAHCYACPELVLLITHVSNHLSKLQQLLDSAEVAKDYDGNDLLPTSGRIVNDTSSVSDCVQKLQFTQFSCAFKRTVLLFNFKEILMLNSTKQSKKTLGILGNVLNYCPMYQNSIVPKSLCYIEMKSFSYLKIKFSLHTKPVYLNALL